MQVGKDLYIYHEKQDAALCGVHCVNSLLQGHYFTAVDLMMIAREIDEQERKVMLEMGADTKDFLKFMAEESGNVADDGNYSIQVLAKALSVWGLTPFPITNPEVKKSRENPLGENAFICNLAQHWLTIRKIGDEWYNLNSLLDEPQYLSPFYLSAFMDTLMAKGYTIFVILGDLPRVMPESLDKTWKKVPRRQQTTSSFSEDNDLERALAASRAEETKSLEEAIKMSLNQPGKQPEPIEVMDEDEELQLAIKMSQNIAEAPKPEPAKPTIQPEPDKGEGVAELSFRLPDGESKHRRFNATALLQEVVDFLNASGLNMSKCSLFSTFPRKEYTTLTATLKELGKHRVLELFHLTSLLQIYILELL